MVRHLVDEEPRGKALARQAPLHVGERHNDGIGAAVGRLDGQPLQRERLAHLTARSSASISASSSAVPWTRGPVNHLRADTSHQLPAKPSTTATATTVKLKLPN